MNFFKIGCLVTFLFTLSSSFAENKSPKVVVVGAGLAGLTTAYRLQQKGMDVHVYEARPRVGGRVLTATVGGHIAELGGHNITDGGEAENFRGLAKEFGLELIGSKISLDYSYFFTGEEFLSVPQLLKSRQFHPEKLKSQLNALAQKSQNMREVLQGLLAEDDFLYRISSVRLAAYEGGTIDKLSPYYIETLYHMLLGGIAAVHQDKEGEENYIHFLAIQGGNALLPEKMAQRLSERLHLNTPLRAVSKDLEGAYILTFQEGQKIKADILVLAIPASVYEDILFEENVLPSKRLEAIKNVQYGTNAKIMLPFAQPPSKRRGFVNDRLVGFFGIDLNLLTLHYTGAAGRFSHETLSSLYHQDRPMIEKGLGDHCPPFVVPVLAKDEAFAHYEGPVGHSWPNDPYAKGSYSYIASGQEAILSAIQEERGEKVKSLFAPIDQTLYFIGEHASILDTLGTMEAACESGERIARLILQRS